MVLYYNLNSNRSRSIYDLSVKLDLKLLWHDDLKSTHLILSVYVPGGQILF